MQRDAEVVVVGAGMAGLDAAWLLRRDGYDVVVLEAASRPGGRVLDHGIAPGIVAELGATWLGLDHDHANRLVAELGLTTYDALDRGDLLLRGEGEPLRYRGRTLGLDTQGRGELVDALTALSAQAATPSGRADLASQTVESWLRDNVASSAVRAVLSQPALQELCSEPGEVSAATLLAVDAHYFAIPHFLSDWERLRGARRAVRGRVRDGPRHR